MLIDVTLAVALSTVRGYTEPQLLERKHLCWVTSIKSAGNGGWGKVDNQSVTWKVLLLSAVTTLGRVQITTEISIGMDNALDQGGEVVVSFISLGRRLGTIGSSRHCMYVHGEKGGGEITRWYRVVHRMTSYPVVSL